MSNAARASCSSTAPMISTTPPAMPTPSGKYDAVRSGERRTGQTCPTMADVAKAAGVSVMTVSRAVNGKSHVRESTRERILDAVAKLGYVPNAEARSLACAGRCRIALLYDNPSAAFLSEFIIGGLTQAQDSGIQLIVEHCPDGQTVAELIRRLIAHRLDAVILLPPLANRQDLLGGLQDTHLMVVQVATRFAAPCSQALSIDNRAAARTMTEHLIALGHRHLGMIAGDPRQTASTERQQGFLDGLEKAGLTCNPAWIVQGDFSYRSGLTATEELLALSTRPTAIFASNDDMAAAAVATAHHHGLSVPADLSICGFDDTAIASSIWPKLTTIRQPIADMARLAVRGLGAAVHGALVVPRTGRSSIQLPFELVRRSSDGPPPVR